MGRTACTEPQCLYSRPIPLLPPMGRTACTEPQCLYKGDLYLYHWLWKSRAIPLLSLWTVRPVQSLSACTRVHFIFTFGHERVELYLYSLYGPYGLYKASVPIQGCTLPLPLVMNEKSYTSTPPMGRTTCTEPQCLYSRAIPLLCLWAVRPVQSLSACTRVTFTFTFKSYFTASCFGSFLWNHLQSELLKRYCIQLTMLWWLRGLVKVWYTITF
jgi:hypothetical protein